MDRYLDLTCACTLHIDTRDTRRSGHSIPSIFLFLRNRGPYRDPPHEHRYPKHAINLIHYCSPSSQSSIRPCPSTPGSLSAGSPGTRPLVVAGFPSKNIQPPESLFRSSRAHRCSVGVRGPTRRQCRRIRYAQGALTATMNEPRRLRNQTRREGRECARDGTVDVVSNVTRTPYRPLCSVSMLRGRVCSVKT